MSWWLVKIVMGDVGFWPHALTISSSEPLRMDTPITQSWDSLGLCWALFPVYGVDFLLATRSLIAETML
ncbi:hypothetical protein VI817_005919 [Penicillium citrinum]|nr:hypothetical protein VI817_005919 [Penicillium citrinum]